MPTELNSTSFIDDVDLLAYYRFEDNLNDSSGNGLTLTGSTAPTYVTGQFTKGAEFPGTTTNLTRIYTGKTPFSGGWTINVWINPDGVGEGVSGDYANIWGFTGKAVCQIDSISGSNLKIKFYQIFTGTNGGWKMDNYEIPLNDWSMLTVVYNNSSTTNDAIFYVNGEVVASSEYVGAPTGSADTSNDIDIGNNANSGVRAFDGTMDDFSIFERSLSASEVANLYNFVSGFKGGMSLMGVGK